MIKEPERLASWRDTQNNHGPYAGYVFHGGPHKDCVHCGKVPLRNGHWLGCPALEGKGCACANRDALPAATLDLDELERLAKIAQAYAGAVENNGWSRDHLHPSVVLALIERLRALEKTYVHPSQWQCDGCGVVERPVDGRRPDRHESCGGMWIRQERTENA